MNKIEFNEAWDILRSFSFNVKELREQYDVYYRTTRFSPDEDLYSCEVHWTINRAYGELRSDPATTECCIQLKNEDCGAWFIWDNKWGNQKLVLVKKNP